MFKVNFKLLGDSAECIRENKIIGHGDNAYFIQGFEDELSVRIGDKNLFGEALGFSQDFMMTNLPWFYDKLADAFHSLSQNKDTQIDFMEENVQISLEVNRDELINIIVIKDQKESFRIVSSREELMKDIKNAILEFIHSLEEINPEVTRNNFIFNILDRIK